MFLLQQTVSIPIRTITMIGFNMHTYMVNIHLMYWEPLEISNGINILYCNDAVNPNATAKYQRQSTAIVTKYYLQQTSVYLHEPKVYSRILNLTIRKQKWFICAVEILSGRVPPIPNLTVVSTQPSTHPECLSYILHIFSYCFFFSIFLYT